MSKPLTMSFRHAVPTEAAELLIRERAAALITDDCGSISVAVHAERPRRGDDGPRFRVHVLVGWPGSAAISVSSSAHDNALEAIHEAFGSARQVLRRRLTATPALRLSAPGLRRAA
jgi:hypothetical protein